MLWYLLSPIRGTTQPPRLHANHPIRKAFYRHGKATAQHWLVAMLVSVAIAMGFSYPTILLSQNPTAGLASFPNHVWTTAKPLSNVTSVQEDDPADVEMRQVWVHGSYMRALDKDVLRSALRIQQTLVGGEPLMAMSASSGDELRNSTLSWGFHSPLMYWNNSLAMLNEDNDILTTINEQAKTTSSPLNLALRPASVLAGKKFDHRRLTAADALVITLMNKVEVGLGGQWQSSMASLTTGACKECTLFPRDGQVTRNHVYEFSIMPLSVSEHIALSLAYGCMAIYVLLALRRLKAFHSKFGLVVTAITQMTCSILASFTICEVLKTNLSMIPKNAYPFVVLVMGIENMFRIINAVLAYPPTMATDVRIANALGDVGPVCAATAVQNVVLLSLLSRVVSPGVAAFCAFACIATLFDAFFLLTFFVAVLMVDIRRFELQDALARANQVKHKRRPSPAVPHTWFDALVHGRLPFSTRMAGTIVTVTFVLSLNYHFFEQEEKTTGLRDLLRLIKSGSRTISEIETFAPPPINASLTPGQWMRMQDFDTAREALRLAKPGADSFIIRVFAPLIVVLGGSDRSDILDEDKAWTTAVRSFAIHHFYPVAVAVVFIVAFVAVLMNFLLYSEQEGDDFRQDSDEEAEMGGLTVQTVKLPHRLDIVMVEGTDNGHFVSVSLDRTIAIGVWDREAQGYRVTGLKFEILSRIAWPIRNVALDDAGEWIACHCADGQVVIYSVVSGTVWGQPFSYPDDNPPLQFGFTRLPCLEGSKLHCMLVTSGGRLVARVVDSDVTTESMIAYGPFLGARLVDFTAQSKRLVLVSDEGRIVSCAWGNGDWAQQTLSQILPLSAVHGRLTGAVRIEQHSEQGTGFLAITTSSCVLLLDAHSLVTLGRLDAEEGQPTISRVMLGESTKCPACGMLAVRCAAIVHDSGDHTECTITSLWAQGGDDAAICLRGSTRTCQSFDKTQRAIHRSDNSGAWAMVASQAVLGLRRKRESLPQSSGGNQSVPSRDLRHRRQRKSNTQSKEDSEDHWETYKLAIDGGVNTVDVAVEADLEDDNSTDTLYVSRAGPAVPLDGQSIAVAFGNMVKIIRSARRGSMARRLTGRSLQRQAAPLTELSVR